MRTRYGVGPPHSWLWPSEFMYFSTYALARLVPPFSYFLTLLEMYGLQLQHLMPHSITLVVDFVHLCEMYMGMWPSVCLFRLFHVLRYSWRSAGPIGGYYFQYRTKGPATYITTLSPDKWYCWRDD
jgi:hypothetical protein